MRQGQAEESIQASFAELVQRRAGPQVGLVVGKHGVGSRDLLLGLIKTPTQDGQEALLASSSASSAGATAPASSSSKQGKKKGAGSSSAAAGGTPQPAVSLALDTDWVVEHAAQVSRMLPGGLAILGLYVFCAEPSYQSVVAQLCAVLAAIASICCQSQGDASSAVGPLLLHADASSRKLSLRSFDAQDGAGKGGTTGGQLRMADLKFASSIGSLVCLRCSHALDLALPTPASCRQLRQQLQDLGEEACQAVSCAVAVVADSTHSTGSGSSPPITIPPESAPLMECIPPSPTSTTTPSSNTQAHVTSSSADRQPSQTSPPSSTPVLPITLFTPVGIRSSSSATSGTRGDGDNEGGKGEGRRGAWASLEVVGAVGGQARLQGTVQGIVYCHQRETFGRSVVALKADLQASLRARMELVLEDATAAWEAQQQQQQQDGVNAKGPQHPLLREGSAALSRAVAMPLPRRVLVPWMGQSLVLCDYLLPGEGVEAAAERAAELLSPPIASSSVTERAAELLSPPLASSSVTSQASHLQADASPILILEAPSTSITAKQLPPWQPQSAPAAPVMPGKPAPVHAATMNGGTHARSWACKGGGAALAAGVAVMGVALGWMSVYSS